MFNSQHDVYIKNKALKAIIRLELQDAKSFFYICNYVRVLNLYNKNNTYHVKEYKNINSVECL
jgi:hypothetical protein